MNKTFALGLASLTLNAGFNAGIDTGYFFYKEFVKGSKFMEDRGLMSGLIVNLNENLSKKWTLNAYARLMAGKTNYDGVLINFQTGAKTPYKSKTFNIIADTELTFDYKLKNHRDITPFFGLGYRRLKNPADDYGGSYDRYETYYYLPMGVKTNNGWKLEYRWLTYGENDSFKTSDNFHMTMQQREGNGFHVAKAVNILKDYKAEIYAEYWHISRSTNSLCLGSTDAVCSEPENKTLFSGIKISRDLDL